MEHAKQYYANKNSEIEQLIAQVMAGGANEGGNLPPILQGQSNETVESLLKFLIFIVLHKETGPEDGTSKQKGQKLEKTK